ncbi:MAG: ABC transporter permease [Bacteroidetes bacterium]|nr:ABC transporter permease [Bacteroidota bacterium]
MSDEKKYSQWRAMFAITRASLRSITRSPSAVVFTLAFPLIFIVVFGFMGGGRFSVDVAVREGCNKANPIYMALQGIDVIRLDTAEGSDKLNADLEKGRIDASLLIKDNGVDAMPRYSVFIETTSASPERGNIFKSVLNNIFYTLNEALMTDVPAMAELKETQVSVRQYKTIDFILPGQLGFSLLSTGVFGTAFVFLSLRQTLVIKRFFATPIKRQFIVIGEALSRLIFALIGALIIILIGHFAFGFTLIYGVTTVLNMLVLSALGLIVFMGFGFVVSGIAKNENAVPPIANIITLPQFLLSGTFFPITAFPEWLQPICKVLPLTYLNDAMRKVAFEGMNLVGVSHQILVVGIWGAVIYMLAFKFFKWE